MTLNSQFALNTVLRVESFNADALVLRHDCVKIDGDAHILSAAAMQATVCGFWRYEVYADIYRGSLLRWYQMRVRSSKMRVFSDRYRNSHGFARFPCDSTALVVHTFYQYESFGTSGPTLIVLTRYIFIHLI